jgi:predicted ATPase
MMRRYVLTGAPGSGKTTLLRALAGRGWPVVEEAATDVIAGDQARGVDEPWRSPGFVARIAALQRARELAAIDGDVVFFDRSPVCTLALSRYLAHPVPASLVDQVKASAAAYAREVFLVRPLGFVEPTAARRISYRDSLAFERVHEEVYRELGFTLVDVPAGPVADRADLVESYVRGSAGRVTR